MKRIEQHCSGRGCYVHEVLCSALVQSSTQFLFSDELIHASSHTSSLGVLFNERFSFNKHISATCKVAYYHLRNIAHTKEDHLDHFLP